MTECKKVYQSKTLINETIKKILCVSVVEDDDCNPTFKLQMVSLPHSNVSHKHLSCESITEIQHPIMLATLASVTLSKIFQS